MFYEVEGDFDSDSFKIICKDFFLMDLGSGAYTEFDEDGTAIDYMVQHPELLDCQMALMHSHDRMATFFSGTDQNTLRSEGNDRNNFVSLIVNNAGTYTAAITRKVEYTEKHDIEISGKYPFFGTRRVLETQPSFRSEERKSTVIEYFELTVEKHEVEFHPDEYDARFDEVVAKRTKQTKTTYNNLGEGYGKDFGEYNGGYYGGYFHQNIEDDDYPELFPYKGYGKQSVQQLPAKKEEPDTKDKKDFLAESEVFNQDFVKDAKSTPVLSYKLNELFTQIITGCPVISLWVKNYEMKASLFNEILKEFEGNYTSVTYNEFVYHSLGNILQSIEPEDYFPKDIVDEQNGPSAFQLEGILIVRLVEILNTMEITPLVIGALKAFEDYYSCV